MIFRVFQKIIFALILNVTLEATRNCLPACSWRQIWKATRPLIKIQSLNRHQTVLQIWHQDLLGPGRNIKSQDGTILGMYIRCLSKAAGQCAAGTSSALSSGQGEWYFWTRKLFKIKPWLRITAPRKSTVNFQNIMNNRQHRGSVCSLFLLSKSHDKVSWVWSRASKLPVANGSVKMLVAKPHRDSPFNQCAVHSPGAISPARAPGRVCLVGHLCPCRALRRIWWRFSASQNLGKTWPPKTPPRIADVIQPLPGTPPGYLDLWNGISSWAVWQSLWILCTLRICYQVASLQKHTRHLDQTPLESRWNCAP